MTIFLVILAILLMGGTAVLASGRTLPAPFRQIGAASVSGSTAVHPREDFPARLDTGLVEPVASLPPVLLPDTPSAQDVDAVRFGLGLRGYRMDQVDEVLDRLAVALEERDAVIRDLQSRIAAEDAG